MNEKCIVRPAEPLDSENIVNMQRELAEYCGLAKEDFGITAEHVNNIIKTSDSAGFFVAENKVQPVGMIFWNRIRLSWRGVSGVYVEDLFIDETRRGEGVGKRLLARVCQLALTFADGNEDAAFVRLDTSANDNEDTQQFYRRVGMNEDNINFRMYGKTLVDLAKSVSSE